MRGATPKPTPESEEENISIHAPHAGRDFYRHGRCRDRPISIHAPHAGRDADSAKASADAAAFQSTRPMRGATVCDRVIFLLLIDFNPRAPCGARLPRRRWRQSASRYFNPRAPCGARHAQLKKVSQGCISIHAPHAGRDNIGAGRIKGVWNFNPRAPCGARRNRILDMASHIQFQSTRPMRGATTVADQRIILGIGFQSTRPMRGATVLVLLNKALAPISIHAPHAGRDPSGRAASPGTLNFNPRAPCGARRRRALLRQRTQGHFNPRAPCGARRS